jgi:murein DD-endopeptidase MepM/ murein hydrolase activator NlpD
MVDDPVDTTQAQIDRLKVIQQQLTAARAGRQAEAQVAADRRAAATALRAKRALEPSRVGRTTVRLLLGQRQALERAAADDRPGQGPIRPAAAEERTSVERGSRSESPRPRLLRPARRLRSGRPRPESRLGVRQKHIDRGPAIQDGSPAELVALESSASASHGFSYPVSAPITSPFGMRFHPVLHYWKLHDGTDFGAGCGTPIRAVRRPGC